MLTIDEVRRVLVLGGGTMGRQIGLQCARFGYEVRIYDILPEALACISYSDHPTQAADRCPSCSLPIWPSITDPL